ncbi:MAG: FMN-binding protein [Candidatus Marinimicrobia bacterium]|nr:FMN-binding protein [Candidatus Neomarinimicrobiota bacterium]
MIILLSILVIFMIIIILGMVNFKKQYSSFFNEINREYERIENIDPADIPDGVYRYHYGRVPVYVDLSLHVKDQVIDTIIIHKQSSGPGYEAHETIDRILKDQKLKVDAVSGATISSKCIMVASYKALKDPEE